MMKDRMKKFPIRLLVIVACIAAMTCCTVGIVLAANAREQVNYIYFDLAAGDVTIDGDTYTGYAYQKSETGGYICVKITGTIGENEAYYVYQSQGGATSPDGYFTVDTSGHRTFTLPTRNAVWYDGKSWGDYVTNNSDVNAVIGAWNTAAPSAGRTSTAHRIKVIGKVNATIVADNLWSSYHTKNNTQREDGGISFYPQTNDSHLTIKTKGDNRFGNIFYSSCNSTNASLTFDEYETGATLTVADFVENGNGNYWNSAIGATDNIKENAEGLVFNGGTVFAGTTERDDCTAIGGGGNGIGGITINGGRITATVTSSGAAIGGGIGKTSPGGQANVTITGGEVYAYNFSCECPSSYTAQGVPYIPAAAIGGGSSGKEFCKECTVTITGGKVYAQSVGGTAIGGGSSADNTGGKATVTIKGDAYVEAKSISGSIGGQEVPAGAAIGGGTGGKAPGKNGGDVTLTIGENATVIAGSIGGGKTTSDTGKIGAATVTISGGTMQGQIVMAQGSETKCSFTMTGGKIDNSGHDASFVFLQENGAIWMDDANGEAKISGGIISGCNMQNGGAVYMTAGKFELSGDGKIANCSATDNGGAVYMGGGTFDMSGGTITNCSATGNGGAVYMGNGTFCMSNGTISSCKAVDGAGVYLNSGSMTVSGGAMQNNIASRSGGGAYLGGGTLTVSGGMIQGNSANENGGAFFVTDGDYLMTGGTVSGNKAVNGDGGAVYVSSSVSAKVRVRSGSITGNTAGKSGGALGVRGQSGATFTVTIGSNTNHAGLNDRHVCDGDTDSNEPCPIIKGNTSTVSGGAVYLTGSYSATLNIYCIEEKDNKVGSGSTLSDFMMVEGGTLSIGSAQENGCNVEINSTVYVTGGKVTVEGKVSNPKFNASVTVDVDGKAATFEDHRASGDAYTIQYFENFVENGKTSGQYTLIDITTDTKHTVLASMYHHTGYEIQGWTLEGDSGHLYAAGEKVKVNKSYKFYAQWTVVGYTVVFKPGVDSYEGSMEPQSFNYSESKALQSNTFINVGFLFECWYDESDSTKTYQDGETVQGLSATQGATITLVARWTICDHNDANRYTLTSTVNSVTRQCACRGYAETVLIADLNVTYDGQPHGAIVTYNRETQNGIRPTKEWDFAVTYSGTDNDHRPIATNGLPTNAGEYTATIRISDELKISAQIHIERAQCPCVPAAPTYTVTESGADNIIEITDPNDPNTAFTLEYQFSWYEETTLKSDEWKAREGNVFPSKTLDKTYTNYYVDVRYAQSCNYYASVAVRGAALFWTGKVTFQFSADTGLSYTYAKSEGEGITVTLIPMDGYYIYKAEREIGFTGEADYTLPKLEDMQKTGTQWTIWIHDIQDATGDNQVTINIRFFGAEKKTTVSSSGVRGEAFGDISAKDEAVVTISRDSAFTVQFAVEHFRNYADASITFGRTLPIGSTVIMIDRENGTYWSYTVASSDVTAIPLTEFSRMGKDDDKFSVVEGTLSLQFVVDFSQCTDEPSIGELTVALTATPVQPTGLSTVPTMASGEKKVTLVEKPSFAIGNGGIEGMTASVTYQFAYSQENIGLSKWEALRGILRLEPKSGVTLPADTRLQVQIGNATVIYPLTNGGFTVALPADSMGTAKITLLSDFLPNEDKTISFDAWLYASATKAGTTPKTQVVTDSVEIAYAVTKTPSYAIYAQIDGKLPTYDGKNAGYLSFKGEIEAPTGNYQVKASLYGKTENGTYTSTSDTKQIELDEDGTFGARYSMESIAGTMTNKIGSLSLMLKIELIDPNGKTVDSVPLYFVLIDTRQ